MAVLILRLILILSPLTTVLIGNRAIFVDNAVAQDRVVQAPEDPTSVRNKIDANECGLSITALYSADVDGNGVVNQQDLASFYKVAGNQVSRGTRGDMNSDGIIDDKDIPLFLDYFALATKDNPPGRLLAIGESGTVSIKLGEGSERANTVRLIRKYKDPIWVITTLNNLANESRNSNIQINSEIINSRELKLTPLKLSEDDERLMMEVSYIVLEKGSWGVFFNGVSPVTHLEAGKVDSSGLKNLANFRINFKGLFSVPPNIRVSYGTGSVMIVSDTKMTQGFDANGFTIPSQIQGVFSLGKNSWMTWIVTERDKYLEQLIRKKGPIFGYCGDKLKPNDYIANNLTRGAVPGDMQISESGEGSNIQGTQVLASKTTIDNGSESASQVGDRNLAENSLPASKSGISENAVSASRSSSNSGGSSESIPALSELSVKIESNGVLTALCKDQHGVLSRVGDLDGDAATVLNSLINKPSDLQVAAIAYDFICNDLCPLNREKRDPGKCGCGIKEGQCSATRLANKACSELPGVIGTDQCSGNVIDTFCGVAFNSVPDSWVNKGAIPIYKSYTAVGGRPLAVDTIVENRDSTKMVSGDGSQTLLYPVAGSLEKLQPITAYQWPSNVFCQSVESATAQIVTEQCDKSGMNIVPVVPGSKVVGYVCIDQVAKIGRCYLQGVAQTDVPGEAEFFLTSIKNSGQVPPQFTNLRYLPNSTSGATTLNLVSIEGPDKLKTRISHDYNNKVVRVSVPGNGSCELRRSGGSLFEQNRFGDITEGETDFFGRITRIKGPSDITPITRVYGSSGELNKIVPPGSAPYNFPTTITRNCGSAGCQIVVTSIGGKSVTDYDIRGLPFRWDINGIISHVKRSLGSGQILNSFAGDQLVSTQVEESFTGHKTLTKRNPGTPLEAGAEVLERDPEAGKIKISHTSPGSNELIEVAPNQLLVKGNEGVEFQIKGEELENRTKGSITYNGSTLPNGTFEYVRDPATNKLVLAKAGTSEIDIMAFNPDGSPSSFKVNNVSGNYIVSPDGASITQSGPYGKSESNYYEGVFGSTVSPTGELQSSTHLLGYPGSETVTMKNTWRTSEDGSVNFTELQSDLTNYTPKRTKFSLNGTLLVQSDSTNDTLIPRVATGETRNSCYHGKAKNAAACNEIGQVSDTAYRDGTGKSGILKGTCCSNCPDDTFFIPQKPIAFPDGLNNQLPVSSSQVSPGEISGEWVSALALVGIKDPRLLSLYSGKNYGLPRQCIKQCQGNKILVNGLCVCPQTFEQACLNDPSYHPIANTADNRERYQEHCTCCAEYVEAGSTISKVPSIKPVCPVINYNPSCGGDGDNLCTDRYSAIVTSLDPITCLCVADIGSRKITVSSPFCAVPKDSEAWLAIDTLQWPEEDFGGDRHKLVLDAKACQCEVPVKGNRCIARPTPTGTPQRSPTRAATFTPSNTPTIRFSPSPTTTFRPSNTPTRVFTNTPSAVPTSTQTAKATYTATKVPTIQNTPSIIIVKSPAPSSEFTPLW